MKRLRDVTFVAAAVVISSIATPALAQEPPGKPLVSSSFVDLAYGVPSGNTLKIVNVAGEEMKGKLRGFDRGRIVVEIGGADVVLGEDDVRAITWEEHDSLGNGILIGMAVGAGTSTGLWLLACTNGCDWSNTGQAAAISAFFFAGIGGGIGAAIDYAVKTDRLVYLGSSNVSLSFDVAPIIAPRAQGAALVIRF